MKALTIAGCAALALALAYGPAQAFDNNDPAARGAEHYKLFCATCHGVEGRGDGHLAALLKIAPQNLTALARENGGEFNAERVFNAIDGRHKVGEERDMPVFSDNLAMKTVLDLVEYLKTIQE